MFLTRVFGRAAAAKSEASAAAAAYSTVVRNPLKELLNKKVVVGRFLSCVSSLGMTLINNKLWYAIKHVLTERPIEEADPRRSAEMKRMINAL